LQNLALNVAEKGFDISVFNRTYAKTEAAVTRAKKSGEQPFQWVMTRNSGDLRQEGERSSDAGPGLGEKLHGYEDMKEFVQSLEKPR